MLSAKLCARPAPCCTAPIIPSLPPVISMKPCRHAETIFARAHQTADRRSNALLLLYLMVDRVLRLVILSRGSNSSLKPKSNPEASHGYDGSAANNELRSQ